MKLAHWHKSQGDAISLTTDRTPSLFEGEYTTIYGSSIFTFTDKQLFSAQWPDAICGGTGFTDNSKGKKPKVEDITGTYEHYDYSVYPSFPWSLGFTSRGCRLHCPFCVVRDNEGAIHSTATIYDIWQPERERKVILLDNDFFGQDDWQARCQEIIDGDFAVSLCQGINVRLITDEQAMWLAKIHYYNDSFSARRLYIAWDNVKEEARFFAGVSRLEAAGIHPRQIMVYMLIGFDPRETEADILYRYRRIVERGMLPYPTVYNNRQDNPLLKDFQRWVVRRYAEFITWEDYKRKRGPLLLDKALPNML